MKTVWSAVLLASVSALAQSPEFTKDGLLIRPDHYREWVFLSSGLGMTYGPLSQGSAREDHPRFDNVFVNPGAYRAFLQTGAWPDQTIFVLEVRDSASNGSINKGGHYQDEIAGVQAEVKDSSRFAKKWAYFGFGKSGEPAKELPQSQSCFACHSTNGGVENTFVQFYPTLVPIAKAKGTLKASAK